MSQILINEYLADLDRLKKVSGTRRETVVREAFKDLTPLGYWEAKDANDGLAVEIRKKFKSGYPRDNILFTDDVTAVL